MIKNKKKGKLLSWLLAVALVFTMMPAMASVGATEVYAGAPTVNTAAPVVAKAAKSGSKTIKLSWNKIDGANKYVIYGTKCGKNKKYKKMVTVTDTSYAVKKVSGKKLKKHTNYISSM